MPCEQPLPIIGVPALLGRIMRAFQRRQHRVCKSDIAIAKDRYMAYRQASRLLDALRHARDSNGSPHFGTCIISKQELHQWIASKTTLKRLFIDS
jgi:hypothetical protein